MGIIDKIYSFRILTFVCPAHCVAWKHQQPIKILQYGIIGYPLSHTFSPAYFRKKFSDMQIKASYDAYPLAAITEFEHLLESKPLLTGLNVTIPYKETVMPFLHEIDEVAAATGATNCIVIRDGYRKGYNTDVTGFQKSLIPLLTKHHSKALVLGAGGSAKAVTYVLTELGIPFRTVSRNDNGGTMTYEELTPEMTKAHKLIINTTPLGMYPLLDAAPSIPYDSVGPEHLLYDLIYNPEETRFLLNGRERGAITKNGFEMLLLQAEASWDIWTHPE